MLGFSSISIPRLASFFVALVCVASSFAQDKPPEADEPQRTPPARVVTVPLPLMGASADRVAGRIEHALAHLHQPTPGGARPILLLEFQSAPGTAGEGNEFEAALKLARLLTGDKAAGVRTVAYLPRSVKGHAVLAVIACDEILMASEAEFGAAGIDDAEPSPLVRASYEEIAQRRRTIPVALALGMLDRNVKLLKALTLEGSRVITEGELLALEKATTVSSTETLKPAGEYALYTGNKWRHELGYISHLAADRSEVLAALKLPAVAFEENPLLVQEPQAVRVNFDGPVNHRNVDRAIKIIGEQLKDGKKNLLFLFIRSEGGSLDQSLRLAHFLTFELDRDRVRTVAYVSNQALGDAAIVALACDELVMEEGSLLGGDGAKDWTTAQFEAAIPRIRDVMQHRDRAWSPAFALAGWTAPIRTYTHIKTNERRLYSEEEHAAREDRDDWTADVQPVDLTRGVSAAEAEQFGWARHRTANFEDVRGLYRVEGEIVVGRINWALDLIEKLSDRRLAGILLFIGTFALFNELSHPGIGVAGFISGVCFLLFFWANFLHGNADMLELLLFVAGVACVIIELFIAPGTLVFGLGGAVMIVVSIVLASQTFVLPTNAYQMRQVPGSLYSVIGGGLGAMIGIFILQRYLHQVPYFKRLILNPLPDEEIERIHERERLASFDFLLGKRGIAVTPLVPSGKVRFGDDVYDVVSDGTLIEPGTDVTVTEVLGNRVVVRNAVR